MTGDSRDDELRGDLTADGYRFSQFFRSDDHFPEHIPHKWMLGTVRMAGNGIVPVGREEMLQEIVGSNAGIIHPFQELPEIPDSG
jgi:hypothetical protein